METKQAKEMLGCQIWVEPTDSRERVDELVRQAADSGLGWLRCFLMWPWIEAAPDQWDFRVFDDLFDAAAKYGIKIKATLTANSGPWFLGTPSLLHSHTGFLSADWREPMGRYIQRCVTRYRRHPGLGQWILWNEPSGGGERTPETREQWGLWLRREYGDDLSALNQRWRTGFASFDEALFPEELNHPLHRGSSWQSYRPWMDNCRFKAWWLAQELAWVRDEVRKYDADTPICVNPCPFLSNQAAAGVDLEQIGAVVDVLGASYHPAWHFTFADRVTFPALMAAGVRKKAAMPSAKQVEITEVQTGNTLNSSVRPSAVEPSEVVRFYLSGLFSGAQSVTGWLLNARSRDFEAGDWGLLDDTDSPSPRSRMMRRLHDTLNTALERAGAWRPAQPRAFVGYSLEAQAVEVADTNGAPVNGRRADDSGHGTALLSVLLMEQGAATEMRRLQDVPEDGAGALLVLSHVVSWELEDARRILAFARSGGTVVLDATSGRKDTDAGMHRPWPGFLAAEIGMRAAGLRTDPKGYALCGCGTPLGRLLLTRMEPVFAPDAGWSAWEDLRYEDGEPLVWQRSFGQGGFVLVNGMAGPSLTHEAQAWPVLRRVFDRLCAPVKNPVRPLAGCHSAFALPVDCERGHLTAILAQPIEGRGGQRLRIVAPAGVYEDLWTGETVEVGAQGEAALLAEDGIVLLWQP